MPLLAKERGWFETKPIPHWTDKPMEVLEEEGVALVDSQEGGVWCPTNKGVWFRLILLLKKKNILEVQWTL